MSDFNCAYCSSFMSTIGFYPTVRCDRCGAVHHPDGTVISPRMIAIPDEGDWRASPWMLTHTRPVERGNYEVRFTNVERVLRLYWDGSHFTWMHRRVRCNALLTWRGAWAMSP